MHTKSPKMCNKNLYKKCKTYPLSAGLKDRRDLDIIHLNWCSFGVNALHSYTAGNEIELSI